MAKTLTKSLSIQWTPPASPTGSGNSSMTTTLTYNASSVGQLDIPSGTANGTDFTVPMGSVALPKFVLVENKTDKPMTLSINSSSDLIDLPSSSSFCLSSSTAPSSHPITSVVVTTTDTSTVDGVVNYFVFGD